MNDAYAYLGWMAVIVVAVGAGWLVVMFVRRWSRTEVEADTFTIQDLREMRARGDISDQEFAAMRSVLLAQMAADRADEPPEEGTTSPGDPQ